MNPIPVFQVDAFTTEPFRGNPAAVCLLSQSADDRWLQNVAAEMNLSETAFVYPDSSQLRIRWMTPKVEVDLCGHATLAAAHVLHSLSQQNLLPEFLKPFCNSAMLQFNSRSGILTAEFAGDRITLDFPASTCTATGQSEKLFNALGVTSEQVIYFGRTEFDLLLQLSTAQAVRQLSPHMSALAEIPARGILVTALGDAADHDVISRFFAPSCGIDEDPVTGSAHCALAPFWAPQFGRNTLYGYQASARGGRVQMELRGDRVRLTGQAITVLEGNLLLP